MAKNLNINPYYDDFDEKKNYHQILFKPGLSVQSRELTQIQSILKNQIATFGDHIFQHGSIVIPGNSTSEIRVPYIKATGQLGGSIDLLTILVLLLKNVKTYIKWLKPTEHSLIIVGKILLIVIDSVNYYLSVYTTHYNQRGETY